MRILLLITLVVFPVAFLCCSEDKESKPTITETDVQYDFRKTRWGMTIEQVKASENIKPWAESDDLIVYKITVAIMPTSSSYSFVNNKLARAHYFFEPKHINDTLYIDDFDRVKNILTSKYGEPAEDDVLWKDDLYKDRPQDYGIAIRTGHLSYRTQWDTPNSRISLYLGPQSGKILFGTRYESKNLESEVLEKKLKEDQEAF